MITYQAQIIDQPVPVHLNGAAHCRCQALSAPLQCFQTIPEPAAPPSHYPLFLQQQCSRAPIKWSMPSYWEQRCSSQTPLVSTQGAADLQRDRRNQLRGEYLGEERLHCAKTVQNLAILHGPCNIILRSTV